MLTGCNDDEDGSFIQEVTDYTNDQKSDFRPQVSNVQDSKYIQDKKVMSVISETQNSLFDSRASTANINNQGSIVDGSNNYVSKIQENSSINQCESNLVKDSVIISVTEVSKTKNLTDEPKIISVNNQPIISGKNNTGNASNYVFFWIWLNVKAVSYWENDCNSQILKGNDDVKSIYKKTMGYLVSNSEIVRSNVEGESKIITSKFFYVKKNSCCPGKCRK